MLFWEAASSIIQENLDEAFPRTVINHYLQ
jgi:hypothetical protein